MRANTVMNNNNKNKMQHKRHTNTTTAKKKLTGEGNLVKMSKVTLDRVDRF